MAEEVVNPARDMPIGIMACITFVTVLYVRRRVGALGGLTNRRHAWGQGDTASCFCSTWCDRACRPPTRVQILPARLPADPARCDLFSAPPRPPMPPPSRCSCP
jgi:amino acid transporter